MASLVSGSASLEAALKTAICHGGAQTSREAATADRVASGVAAAPLDETPSAPGPECEICRSLAGMSLALLAAAELGLLAPVAAPVNWPIPDSAAGDLAAIEPRSRGPPASV